MAARKRVAILGSGSGTNARAICDYAKHHQDAYEVAVIISTSPHAGICQIAHDYAVALEVVQQGVDLELQLSTALARHRIDALALAGFMRLLPIAIIEQLQGRVLNIHPALLPNFGGKGMYGIHVHEAVIAANSLKTGATVHLVTPAYDEGAILAQAEVMIPPGATPHELQQTVKDLEHKLYPATLSAFLRTS